MSEMYPLEKQAQESETPTAAEIQEMDARLGKAEPTAEASVQGSENGDQDELQKEVSEQQFSSKTEADSRIEQAHDSAKEINVNGFEKSGVMSDGDVQQYLKDTLPPEHIQGDRITEIRYPNQYNSDGDSVTYGVCTTDRETAVSQIEIYNQNPDGSNDRELMERTITHEVGHNVYYNMPEEQQAEWDSLSSSSRYNEYVSNYAMTNGREDFAESYSYYVHDPERLLARAPAKYDFMRTYVFNGRQYGI